MAHKHARQQLATHHNEQSTQHTLPIIASVAHSKMRITLGHYMQHVGGRGGKSRPQRWRPAALLRRPTLATTAPRQPNSHLEKILTPPELEQSHRSCRVARSNRRAFV